MAGTAEGVGMPAQVSRLVEVGCRYGGEPVILNP